MVYANRRVEEGFCKEPAMASRVVSAAPAGVDCLHACRLKTCGNGSGERPAQTGPQSVADALVSLLTSLSSFTFNPS